MSEQIFSGNPHVRYAPGKLTIDRQAWTGYSSSEYILLDHPADESKFIADIVKNTKRRDVGVRTLASGNVMITEVVERDEFHGSRQDFTYLVYTFQSDPVREVEGDFEDRQNGLAGWIEIPVNLVDIQHQEYNWRKPVPAESE